MTNTFRDNCDKNILQQTRCEPLSPDVPMQLKMYFFVHFVHPCMHHNYRVTQKKVITKNRITSKILFRLTQNFSYIRSSKPVQHSSPKFQVCTTKTLCFTGTQKNVLLMSSPTLQAHLDPAGKLLDDPPPFLPWHCSYCCLQVRDSLGVVVIHPGLKVSPQIKIWGNQVR